MLGIPQCSFDLMTFLNVVQICGKVLTVPAFIVIIAPSGQNEKTFTQEHKLLWCGITLFQALLYCIVFIEEQQQTGQLNRLPDWV